MSSLTTRMGLKRAVTADPFLTQDQFDLLTLLDAYPGIFICTSGTRPAGWGAAHSGMHIWETDRALLWRWTGSAWARAYPVGLLSNVSLTADFPTAATTPTACISTTVAVPATHTFSTGKRIEVTASWYAADNGTATTLGAYEVSLFCTSGSTRLATQLKSGRPNTATSPLDWGEGGSIVGYYTPAIAGGSFTFTLCINSLASVGGTTTMRASATTPATLTVKEVGL